MDFSDSISKWRTDAFEDALYEDLESHAFDLPLEKICEAGGWADREDAVEFNIAEIDERSDRIVVTAEVWFTERAPGGCPDLPNHEPRFGKVTVEIDKTTGLADATAERSEMPRNLENY